MIISLLIFVAYAILCYSQFGVTKDFSATYYKWRDRYLEVFQKRIEESDKTGTKLRKPFKYYLLFPLWILGITFPLIFKVEALEYWFAWSHSFWWFGWIPILAMGLLWLVFFAPNYRNKPFNVLHVIGASGGIIVFLVFTLLLKTWYFTVPFIVFMLLLKKNKIKINHTTYWVELFAYVTIWLALFFN
jgi:hypothetical protein